MEKVYSEYADFDPRKALAERGVSVETLSFAGAEDGSPSSEYVGVVVEKLETLYPESVTVLGSANYEDWRAKFWSLQQREARPACIFQPKNADQVAAAVLLCRWARCKFAVKSGGHAAMKDASSSDGGITIDLELLAQVALSSDRKVAMVGAGARWGYVYDILAKDGLAVAGGRHSDVGVGGYLLGGGISLFTSLYGWACDMVTNFELVTASGQILNVNLHSYPDLYWALRGGGSNFGIVTRFDIETFPLGDISAGFITYDYATQGDAVISAFAQLAEPTVDPKASTFLVIVKDGDTRLLRMFCSYTDPNIDASVFNPYRAIPSLDNAIKLHSLSAFTAFLKTTLVNGHRQMYWTNTFKFSPSFISWFIAMFFEELNKLEGAYEHHVPIPYFQIITKDCVRQMQRNGGNCLPFIVEDAPYVNLIYACEWQSREDDAALTGLQKKVMEKAVEEGVKRGVFVDYVYMNYASQYQDVMASYGGKSKRLEEISEQCDPDRVWQKLMPGYFRFGGASRT